jgi:integrase
MLKKTEPQRQVISDDEIEILNEIELPYEYKRWLAIYKPSNRRATEFVKIKREDVNLKEGKVKVQMMKGPTITYPEFTIQDDVLHIWEELYTQAKPGQYLFCKGLKPGEGKHIHEAQIYRRWKRHVKDKTQITSDQYTLKHKNLDELAALENIEFAQKAAGHSSAATTEKHYAKGESERRHEKLKKVSNKLFKEKYPHLRVAK